MREETADYERRAGPDRRSGIDRRVTMLETNYASILVRLDGLDAMKNQITGMVNLVRFVGIGGVLASLAALVHYLSK